MQDLEKTHLFKCQNEVNQLATPLFDYLDFNYFCYGKLDNHDNALWLTSYPKWSSKLLEDAQGIGINWLHKMISSNHPALYKRHNHYFLIMGKDYDNKKIASEFGINDVVLLIDPTENGYNILAFGANGNNTATTTALHRPDTLINFKYNFQSHGKKLIQQAEQDKIVNVSNRRFKKIMVNDMAYDPDSFNKLLNPKYYDVEHNGKLIKISPREREILLYLARAQTAKEVANNMNIAEVTVDSHIKNIKYKLGVATKREMMKFYLQSDLVFLDDHYFTPEYK